MAGADTFVEKFGIYGVHHRSIAQNALSQVCVGYKSHDELTFSTFGKLREINFDFNNNYKQFIDSNKYINTSKMYDYLKTNKTDLSSSSTG